MTSWVSTTILLFGFLALLRVFGIIEKSRYVGTLSSQSFRVIRKANLSDQVKEEVLQRNAKQLFRLFVVLALGGAAAFLLPAGLLYVGDRLEWVSLESVFAVAISPTFLLISGAITIFYFFLPHDKMREMNGYSLLDRCLHRVAFKTYTAQVSLVDFEDRMFAEEIAMCKADRPVFITALPRAGTTLLLQCLTTLPEFASHCYRDMPFVIIPCFWNRFSSNFQQTGSLRERAHGDGVLIDFDSPEAFEEILWKNFWRKHYRSDHIIPWQEDHDDEFAEFYRNHMKKVILLRCRQDKEKARYVSKNNLNIARTGMLKRLFPDSLIIVPFRQPLHHATSLLEQHQNFLRIHDKDPFTCEYMREIGHYDFGKNLCPVNFGGWMDKRHAQSAESLSFWLEYWIATYSHLLKERSELSLFNYDALCKDPNTGLQQLAKAIGSKNRGAFLSFAPMIRTSTKPRELDTKSVTPRLLEDAYYIYERLKEAAMQ